MSDLPTSPKPPAAQDPTKERRILEAQCPGLAGKSYELTSGSTTGYNCVAYANGEIHRPWSPQEPYYWPTELLRTPFPSVASMVQYFAARGFHSCTSVEPHPQVERIAIYGDDSGCLHLARQLGGDWLSKMGDAGDIEHGELAWIESPFVGTVREVLCKHYHDAPARPAKTAVSTSIAGGDPSHDLRPAGCGYVVEIRVKH